MAEEIIKFGTDGWRSLIAHDYTFDNLKRVARALALHLRKTEPLYSKGIAIGYDTRFLSKEFALATAQTLAENGVPAFLSSRDCPTPAIAWATRSRGLAGGVMITASHNPPQYNGFKFMLPTGRSADTAATKSVESFLRTSSTRSKIEAAQVVEFDPRPEFLDQLRSIIDTDLLKKAKGRAVCDFVHGVGRDYLDVLLRECGWKVTTIRDHPDPMFGGILPDPANPATHKTLQDEVLKRKADLGLANDPDADRFGVVDSTGIYISPNEVIALVYVHLLEHRGMSGAIARTVATTGLLDAIARKHKQQVIETAVGFKWLGEKLDKNEAILGGEESGGLGLIGHCPIKDGVLADLLIAEVWAAQKLPLSTRVAQINKKYGNFYADRIDVHLTVERKDALMNGLEKSPPQEFAGVKVKDVVTLDGVKLNLEDGSWLLLRASGTEPIVRVYFETTSKKRVKELRAAASQLGH